MSEHSKISHRTATPSEEKVRSFKAFLHEKIISNKKENLVYRVSKSKDYSLSKPKITGFTRITKCLL